MLFYYFKLSLSLLSLCILSYDTKCHDANYYIKFSFKSIKHEEAENRLLIESRVTALPVLPVLDKIHTGSAGLYSM